MDCAALPPAQIGLSSGSSVYYPPIIDAQGQKVNRAAKNSFAKSMWTKVNTGGGVLAFLRHAGRAIPRVGPKSSSMAHLGLVTNGIGVLDGINKIKNASVELQRSKHIGDREGVALAGTHIASGSLGIGSSSLMLTCLVSNMADWGTELAAQTGFAGTAVMGAGSALGMGVATYRLAQLCSLRKKLTKMEKSLGSAHAESCARQALETLKGMISISEAESNRIAADVEKNHSDLSTDEQEALFSVKCSELTQSKINHLKRRTGLKSIRLIATHADDLLKKLDNRTTAPDAVEKTAELIKSIKSQNGKKIAFYIAAFIASALGFAAFIAATVFSCGTLPFILLAIASAIGLGAMLVDWIASKLQKTP